MATNITSNDYEFFSNIDMYMKKVNGLESFLTRIFEVAPGVEVVKGVGFPSKDDIIKNCNIFSKSVPLNGVSSEEICKKFICLIGSMPSVTFIQPLQNIHKIDCGFLKYWLNLKLKHTSKSSSFKVEDFYKIFKNHFRDFKHDLLSKCEIKDMENDVLENMRMLYELYVYRDELYNFLTPSSTDYSKQCSEYINGCISNLKSLKDKCTRKNSEFCEALDVLKKQLQFLIISMAPTNICDKKLLNELSNELGLTEKFSASSEIGKGMSNVVISTALSLLALLFICFYTYKYTPFGTKLSNIIQGKIIDIKYGHNKNNNSTLNSSEKHRKKSNAGEYSILYY
ncbi:variable surface protein [Plasmodium gonderi]|uniref:Variable surface protein n=1 Tax=Plasmodium gonderi TaxID=77519 RepID=A0A1Y1JJR9_PLAGO|nr:variable surface protein [Plasmodium gonderi]GAW82746.1 variable surface protein [Plasmodium gonderi]